MSYQLTITNHPAQAKHPFTGEPLFDSDGNPVPLFADQKAIRLDGRVIAYVNAVGKVLFIVPQNRLGVIAQEAIELAGNKGSHAVAELQEIEEETEEDD